MNRSVFLFSQILSAIGILSMVFLIGRTAVSSVKEKKPGMNWFDHMVYAAFLGLFIISCLLLIKCGILDPVRVFLT